VRKINEYKAKRQDARNKGPRNKTPFRGYTGGAGGPPQQQQHEQPSGSGLDRGRSPRGGKGGDRGGKGSRGGSGKGSDKNSHASRGQGTRGQQDGGHQARVKAIENFNFERHQLKEKGAQKLHAFFGIFPVDLGDGGLFRLRGECVREMMNPAAHVDWKYPGGVVPPGSCYSWHMPLVAGRTKCREPRTHNKTSVHEPERSRVVVVSAEQLKKNTVKMIQNDLRLWTGTDARLQLPSWLEFSKPSVENGRVTRL